MTADDPYRSIGTFFLITDTAVFLAHIHLQVAVDPRREGRTKKEGEAGLFALRWINLFLFDSREKAGVHKRARRWNDRISRASCINTIGAR